MLYLIQGKNNEVRVSAELAKFANRLARIVAIGPKDTATEFGPFAKVKFCLQDC